MNSNDSSTTQDINVTSLPTYATHKITSHTSLHAYWNDPNFDTQSQISNNSSSSKKRRAPKPPGYISPILNQQEIVLPRLINHRQSHESLTDGINGTKQKRKAPIIHQESTKTENMNDQQITESEKKDTIINSTNEPQLSNIQSEQQTSLNNTIDGSNHNASESYSPTPIYSQVQKIKESTQTESPYSTVQVNLTSPNSRQEEIIHRQSPKNYSVNEIVQAGIAEPPSAAGLSKIISDHDERAKIYQQNKTEKDDILYFRVAKSLHGKFETNDQGFINNSSNIFVTTNNNNQDQQTLKTSEKLIPINIQQQTIDSVKNEQLQNINSDEKEKASTPIQVEFPFSFLYFISITFKFSSKLRNVRLIFL